MNFKRMEIVEEKNQLDNDLMKYSNKLSHFQKHLGRFDGNWKRRKYFYQIPMKFEKRLILLTN